MIEAYLKHVEERSAQGIPPRPLDAEQTKDLCRLLEQPPAGKGDFLLDLFKNRIAPGVDPAAEVKAGFLARILTGSATSPLISERLAIEILGTMLGGYNVAPLCAALTNPRLAELAGQALCGLLQVYDAFDEVFALSKENAIARQVVLSWANADWFTRRPALPETISVKVFKV
ncbi:MAG: aconitate hydratase B, partial [Pseudomonadota bacterium]